MRDMSETALATSDKKGLVHDSRGLSTVEYLILLVIIAVASITVWKKIGDKVVGHANKSDTALGSF